jgi:UDP-N-acetylmuramate dehydrogenase
MTGAVATDDEPSAALLAPHTTLGVGGPAGRIVPVPSRAALLEVLAGLPARDAAALLVLGEGSNVVVSDAGFPGSVLLLDGGELRTEVDAATDSVVVTADAGVHWDDLVVATIAAGGTGAELMSGIPGRVGAAPIQNVAAYGQQVCDVIEAVEVVDRESLAVTEVAAADCGFGFRTSSFKTAWRDRFVVSRVRFRVPGAAAHPPSPSSYVDVVKHFERHGGDPTDVGARRAAVLAARRSKSMVLDPSDPLTVSVGSFFLNPTVPLDLARELAERFESAGLPVQYLEGRAAVDPGTRRVPAALLLRASGFNPGDRWGRVKLSDRHVLAIVAEPGATATDVANVAAFVRRRVLDATGVALECEATFVGEFPPFDAEQFLRTTPYEPAGEHEPDWLVSYR